MNHLVIGLGEVGKSIFNILKEKQNTHGIDKLIEQQSIPAIFSQKVDVMHICIRYSDEFLKIVTEYRQIYQPDIINVCTTVPVGTTRKIGDNAVHSTTRGLHPNLEEGLRTIPKHIGGKRSKDLAISLGISGITCVAHNRPETTELAHILNNAAYGVNLMFAEEMAKLCREYGVDYYEAVMKYTETNNAGYTELDNATKVRMILTPPNGRIGGHCVTHSAELIPEEKRTPLLNMLANYNQGENK